MTETRTTPKAIAEEVLRDLYGSAWRSMAPYAAIEDAYFEAAQEVMSFEAAEEYAEVKAARSQR